MIDILVKKHSITGILELCVVDYEVLMQYFVTLFILSKNVDNNFMVIVVFCLALF